MKNNLLATSLCLLILSGCGGGGGGGATQVGQFIDDPVGGLTYSCTSAGSTQALTGTTDSDGHFNYIPGQTCTFKVGNVTLGSLSGIPADGKVTPQDVAGVSRAATAAPSALAIAQFLQSLNDGTTNGKIVIPAATTTALSNVAAVTLVSSTGAISQADLQTVVASAGKTLVSATAAQSALDTQIASGVIDKKIGAVSASAPVVLNSIAVTSAAASNAAGLTEQLTATGYYSDGSTKDLTSSVTWSTADGSTVSVDAAGLAKGLKKGSATVTASYTPSAGATSVTGSFSQGVLDPTPLNLAISYATAGLTSIQNSATALLQAVVSFTDATTQVVSSAVNWVVTSVSGNGNATVAVDKTANTATLTSTSPGVISTLATYLGLTSGNSLNLNITQKLSGTVSAGAVMDSGTVTIFDSTGTVVASNVTINADGTFTATDIPATAVLPFTVKAVGSIGASATTMYALAPNSGTANVNPITNAMAATLAKGDPSTLETGTSVTASNINQIDTAYQTALKNVTTATGASGSLLTSTYNQALDKTLDNVSVNTSPSGVVSISTTSNQASDDMGVGATGGALTAVTFQPNTTATTIAASTSSLTASSDSTLAASDLAWLQQQLTKCFATSANAAAGQTSGAGRFTSSTNPTTPIQACDFSNFTNNTSSTDTKFKHSGTYWMDSAFFSSFQDTNNGNRYANYRTVANNKICGTSVATGSPIQVAIANSYWNTVICRGFFGFMLTSPTYDSAKFLTPQIIRPLNTTKGTWIVRFPILFADGSRDYFGGITGVDYMVVQKIAPVSGNDNGWRMVGDQRDWAVAISASVSHNQNVLNSGYEKWISSIGFFIQGYISETDTTHYIKSANVTGPGLPNGGINFYNNFSMKTSGSIAIGSTRTVTENSGPGNSPLNNAMCGSILGGAYLGISLPAYTGNRPPCTSLYKLTYVSNPANNAPDCSRDIAAASWYYCNNNNQVMPDDEITRAFGGEVGHPYQVTLTLGKLTDQTSDGTITYTARLQSAPILKKDLTSKSLNYLTFSTDSITKFANFKGTVNGDGTTVDSFSPSWNTPAFSPRPYKAQLMWLLGENVINYGMTTANIEKGTVTLNCNSSGNTTSSCKNPSSWFNTSGGSPANGGGGGQFNVWARFPSNLNVSSSLSQY
jgi:hypothetical protein